MPLKLRRGYQFIAMAAIAYFLSRKRKLKSNLLFYRSSRTTTLNTLQSRPFWVLSCQPRVATTAHSNLSRSHYPLAFLHTREGSLHSKDFCWLWGESKTEKQGGRGFALAPLPAHPKFGNRLSKIRHGNACHAV